MACGLVCHYSFVRNFQIYGHDYNQHDGTETRALNHILFNP